ncbi:MAG: M14 family metallopeptidase [Bryobacteraceae bacterium]
MGKITVLAVGLAVSLAAADIPSPQQYLGFRPGDDFKLAGYDQVTGYFRQLAAASPRIQLLEFGKSSLGKPMYVAFLSSEENLRQLARWREISARLAQGDADPAEAKRLAAEGKAIVWIDSGLHASEVAPVQQSFDLAYRIVTGEDGETRRIRDRVILMQCPVINPDGLDWIVNWYRGNVGTPYETAPLPHLYQKYAGHDNNRDWFMLNLEETRHVTKVLYREWFPQIVYNQHQAPAFPARIFVPPYSEPLNPNIPAPVMEGINFIGAAIKERFAREDKPGVLSYLGYDAWWNGGMRSVPAFHNMHGILTETALNANATPGFYQPADFPARFSNGIPTAEPSVFYQRPWKGGKWSVRDAIDYMLTADFAILDLAASRPESFLFKSWELARAAIDNAGKSTPYAYVVPADQWDPGAAADMLHRLQLSGIRVEKARAPFHAAGKDYPAGSHVLPAAQPFRAYLVDLMEPQKYPELRTGESGATKRPYDVAGWTLPFNMGVHVDRVEDRFQADLQVEATGGIAVPPSADHRHNASFLSLADRLARGGGAWWSASGSQLESASGAAYELHKPKVGLYEPHLANIDTGWTQYLLDRYRVPYTAVKNADVTSTPLRDRFDSIILASQSMDSILHGNRDGVPAGRDRPGEGKTIQRPEFTGGIGALGAAKLAEFVRDGGTLIAFDAATELAAELFPIAVKQTNTASSGYYCPGSLLRIDVDTDHPIAFGMPKQAFAFTTGGKAWDITLLDGFNKGDREIRTVAKYASAKVLASGWLSGEKAIRGKANLVEARYGKGRVVLFGFRPQFRAQSAGTFKLILNAIYLASARKLNGGNN